MAAETFRREESLMTSREFDPSTGSDRCAGRPFKRRGKRRGVTAALCGLIGVVLFAGADAPFGGESEPLGIAAEEASWPYPEQGGSLVSGGRVFVPAPSGPTYPAEVRSIVEELAEREKQIREEVNRRFREEQLAVLNRLRKIQDEYTRSGRLDDALAVRELVRHLESKLFDVQPNPGRLTEYRGRTGETLFFRVTGDPNAGTVWGSDVYTDDSPLAAAAVHAGVVQPGETAVVKVTILGGRSDYQSSSRNGVATSSYGAWQGSYRVETADLSAGRAAAADSILDDPGTLTAYHDRVGASVVFRVTGSNDGSVWGSDVYTSDSDLSTAAVHAGVLKVGETGVVRVTMIAGQASYDGTSRNGVASRPWQSWNASYRVERLDPAATGPAPAVFNEVLRGAE